MSVGSRIYVEVACRLNGDGSAFGLCEFIGIFRKFTVLRFWFGVLLMSFKGYMFAGSKMMSIMSWSVSF